MKPRSNLYDENYFNSHCGRPYTRENFLETFRNIAQNIVNDLHPKSVLDVGCAKDFW